MNVLRMGFNSNCSNKFWWTYAPDGKTTIKFEYDGTSWTETA